jgi:hypothetical protein
MNEEIPANEIPDNLPPDYQAHLDNEQVEDKMSRLDNDMKQLIDVINGKVKAVF